MSNNYFSTWYIKNIPNGFSIEENVVLCCHSVFIQAIWFVIRKVMSINISKNRIEKERI